MNRKFRFTIAALITLVLVFSAISVWAAPTFTGTVPLPPATAIVTVLPPAPDTGGEGDVDNDKPQGQQETQSNNDGGQGSVDMGTAEFIPDCPAGCTVNVEKVDPIQEGPAPEGKNFFGDAFKVELTGSGSIKVAFAYPPEFAGKAVSIYKLDTSVNPPVWVEVPGAVVNADGTISVDVSEGGIFSLLGNP